MGLAWGLWNQLCLRGPPDLWPQVSFAPLFLMSAFSWVSFPFGRWSSQQVQAPIAPWERGGPHQMRLLFCQTSPGQGEVGIRGGDGGGGEARLYQQPIKEHCKSIWLITSWWFFIHSRIYWAPLCARPTRPWGKSRKKTQYMLMDLFVFERGQQKLKKEKHSLWILRK